MKYLIVWAVSCAAGAGLMHTVHVHIEDTAAAERAAQQQKIADEFFRWQRQDPERARGFNAGR